MVDGTAGQAVDLNGASTESEHRTYHCDGVLYSHWRRLVLAGVPRFQHTPGH